MVRTLTAGEWTEAVDRSRGTVVVQFGAPWCVWCKRLEPVVDRVAAALEGEATFYRIDVDEFPEMRERFGIQGIPVLLRFADGQLGGRVVGYRPDWPVRAFVLGPRARDAEPLPFAELVDNAGTSDDSAPAAANADGVGWSYSAQALAAQGVTPGAELTFDGVTFRWPDAPPGTPNNIRVAGQPVLLAPRAGAAKLGFLGMATNGPSSGEGTIQYADGTDQPFVLCFSDWTMNGGDGPLADGTHVAARMPRRNSVRGELNDQETMLFVTTVPLERGKTVASVRLPERADQGALHVFAVGLGG